MVGITSARVKALAVSRSVGPYSNAALRQRPRESRALVAAGGWDVRVPLDRRPIAVREVTAPGRIQHGGRQGRTQGLDPLSLVFLHLLDDLASPAHLLAR